MSCSVTVKPLNVNCPSDSSLYPGQRNDLKINKEVPGLGVTSGSIPYCGTDSADVSNMGQYWDQIINQYGVRIDYYKSGFVLKGQQAALYGENPTKKYRKPKRLMAAVEMNPESTLLSRFGIQITSEAKILISFNEYKKFFGPNDYPKAEDLIVLVDAYCDRPLGFGSKVYEITSKTDEIMGETNFQGRHYVWSLDAIRWQSSYEVDAPVESPLRPSHTISESEKIGSSDKPETKSYTETADKFSEENFNNKKNGKNTSIYGY